VRLGLRGALPTPNTHAKKECRVLHPNQFQVNEAWIAFKLNDAPMHAGADGDFDVIALMDAASCFILSSTTLPSKVTEPTALEVRRLMKQAHNNQWPKTIFIPTELAAQNMASEAERLGVNVRRVSEGQLLAFIGETREGFRQRFRGGPG
jgi:hypothetical protein